MLGNLWLVFGLSGGSGSATSRVARLAKTAHLPLPVPLPACVAAANTKFNVTVSCSPAPGKDSFPADSFTVSLTATQNTSLAGCDDSVTETLTVTVDPKPDVVVVAPSDATVCSSDTSKSLTFQVETSQPSAGDITLAVSTNPASLAGVVCTASPAGPVAPTSELHAQLSSPQEALTPAAGLHTRAGVACKCGRQALSAAATTAPL